MRNLIWAFLFFSLTPATFALPVANCPRNPLPGYKYVRNDAEGDRYLDTAKRVTLFVKCFPLKTTPDDLISRLKAEANPKNMVGEAVYFETNTETKYKRIYVITRKPVMQFTFETKWRNRIWLEATEAQVEKYAARKGAKPTFRKK